MKKTSLYLAVTLCLFGFIFQSCKDSDSDPKNEFKYDGKSYALANGYVTPPLSKGVNDSGDSVCVLVSVITSKEIVITDSDASGKGNLLYFLFGSKSSTEITPGTYTFPTDESGFDLFKMVGVLYMNYDIETDEGTTVEVTGGTVVVSRSGTKYKFKVNLTTVDGKTVTGNFIGNLTLIND